LEAALFWNGEEEAAFEAGGGGLAWEETEEGRAPEVIVLVD